MIGPKTMETRCGDVAVRYVAAPPVDGTARPGAMVVEVVLEPRGCGVAYEWPDGGVYVECPLTLAGAIDGLLDACGDAGPATAALDALHGRAEAAERRARGGAA